MRSTIFTLLGLTLSFAACGEDDACGDGLEMKDGACVAASGAGGGGGSSGKGSGGSSGKGGKGGGSGTGGSNAGETGNDAGETGNDAGAAGAPVMMSADFGAACATNAECGGDTDYCAVQPGAAGYCTASGCDADASICPTDWTCFNVGQFAPGEPWVCIKP